MGWFESQIEERERSDSMKLEASLRALSDAVTGKRSSGGMNMIAQAKSALEAVLGYYGAKAAEPPRGVGDDRGARALRVARKRPQQGERGFDVHAHRLSRARD